VSKPLQHKIILFRAKILHFPQATDTPQQDLQCYADGGLAVQGEKILAIGNFGDIRDDYPEAVIHDHKHRWIMPGLIDSHLHFPQTEMLACYGEQLLSWLENYTFPTEKKFTDSEYAAAMAEVFLRQLFKNGTTTGLVYPTVHAESVDALFQAAHHKNMAMVTGKVCMDQHCPDGLIDTPELAYADSKALIERWHGKDRNLYAITPRFAPTSSREQLSMLGKLASEHPDVFIQTHLSENQKEIDWVKQLFPERDGYLDVYDHYGLVRERAVFGHCVHLTDSEWQRMADAKATIAFCPTSNLFLGSGLFDMNKARTLKVPVTLATDVGAGTTFNMFRTYGEGYKVCQLQQTALSPIEGLYLMTQGAAHAHKLSAEIGNLNPGTFADFIIVEPAFDELTEHRLNNRDTAEEMLFALSMLGDDRTIVETWIAGSPQYKKQEI